MSLTDGELSPEMWKARLRGLQLLVGTMRQMQVGLEDARFWLSPSVSGIPKNFE